jgi:hypothetical protein
MGEQQAPASLCRHGSAADLSTSACFIAELGHAPARPAHVWCCLGSPCTGPFLPIFLDGDLPEPFCEASSGTEQDHPWRKLHSLFELWPSDAGIKADLRRSLAQLQARVDAETEEICQDAQSLKETGELTAPGRQIALFMQNHIEQMEAEYLRLKNIVRSRQAVLEK